MKTIPFNKPYFTGKEIQYIQDAVAKGHISGNGYYTKECHHLFKQRFGFAKCLLTTSCTDALEICAMLLDLQLGDEVIMPSYTFVSCANAFISHSAKVIFADSLPAHPNIDPQEVKKLITPNTKAILIVHYGGVPCDIKSLRAIADENNVILIEDAAHSIDSSYDGQPLGSFGDLSTFSFHETKNISSGEGGMLVINNPDFAERSEILWEKGTNRSAFFRGEVDKYNWVDIGSSFLPSDIIAACLFAQLESINRIQSKRKSVWQYYYENLSPVAKDYGFQLLDIAEPYSNNGHLFCIVTKSLDERTRLIKALKDQGIHAVFHYLSLHKSPFYKSQHDGRELPNSDKFTERLLRLPLYYSLSSSDQDRVIETVMEFYS